MATQQLCARHLGQYFSRVLWGFMPFYLVSIASLCFSQAQYYGPTALLHVQLLIPLIITSICFLTAASFFTGVVAFFFNRNRCHLTLPGAALHQ